MVQCLVNLKEKMLEAVMEHQLVQLMVTRKVCGLVLLREIEKVLYLVHCLELEWEVVTGYLWVLHLVHLMVQQLEVVWVSLMEYYLVVLMENVSEEAMVIQLVQLKELGMDFVMGVGKVYL